MVDEKMILSDLSSLNEYLPAPTKVFGAAAVSKAIVGKVKV